ncbi:MAG: hypothetical protein LBR08_05970 [Bacteroidales bacterium]|nr:hypothetical protein [Bacteroidales bacterium]
MQKQTIDKSGNSEIPVIRLKTNSPATGASNTFFGCSKVSNRSVNAGNSADTCR